MSCAFIFPGVALAQDDAPQRTPFVKALDRLNQRLADRPEGGHERDAWDKAFVDSLPLINIPPEATILSDFTTQWQSPVFVTNNIVSFVENEIASAEEKAQYRSAYSMTRAYQMLWNVDTGERTRVAYLGHSKVGKHPPCADTAMPGVTGLADFSEMPQEMQDIMAEDKKLLLPKQEPEYRAFFFRYVEGPHADKTYFVLFRNAYKPEIVNQRTNKNPADRVGNILATNHPILKEKLTFTKPGEVGAGPGRFWNMPVVVGEALSGKPFECRKWSQSPAILAHWNQRSGSKLGEVFSTTHNRTFRKAIEKTFVDRRTDEVAFSIPLTRMDYMPLGTPDDAFEPFSVWYDTTKERYFFGALIDHPKINRRFYWVYRHGWRVEEVSLPGNFASSTPTKYGVIGSVPGARVHLRDNGTLEHWRLNLPYDKELAAKARIKPEYYSPLNPSPDLCRGVGIWFKDYIPNKYHLSLVQNADYQLVVVEYCSDIFRKLMGE